MPARVTIAANNSYGAFLRSKLAETESVGIEIAQSAIHPTLFDFQKDVVQVALSKGRYAAFEECGLGKTFQEIEFARLSQQDHKKRVLILAPLAVAFQTVEEARKLDVEIVYVRSQEEAEKASTPIVISNYEMVKEFEPTKFGTVVLDESGILKAFTGTTKQLLTGMFSNTPYRLAATATPAPNDHLELGNHAEFLGVMPSNLMIARWFINDAMKAGAYRLKRHAEKDFWRWVTSWAVCISKPSDLGYSDEGFELPPLNWHQSLVEIDHTASWARQIEEKKAGNKRNLGKSNFGQLELFAPGVSSATSLWRDKALTLEDRCKRVADIVATDPANPWIVWVDLNSEADYLRKLLPDAIEVRGSDPIKEKERKLMAFTRGEERVIITKAEIAGFGLNWQHCNQMVLAGANFSYEKLHQQVRRCYRFRQTRPVHVHLVASETDNNVLAAIQRKQDAFQEMQRAMNEAMREHGLFNRGNGQTALLDYNPQVPMEIPGWCFPHTENYIEVA